MLIHIVMNTLESQFQKCRMHDEEIGLCIVILGTYIHREPSVAAAILPDILRLVSKFASLTTFPWQSER